MPLHLLKPYLVNSFAFTFGFNIPLFSLLVHPATRYRFVYISASAGSFYFSWFQVDHISAVMAYTPFDPVSFAGLWFAHWTFRAFYIFFHRPAPFMKSFIILFRQDVRLLVSSLSRYGSGNGIHAVTK